MDIHSGNVCPFYSEDLTNLEKLPFFGHFYTGRVFYFSVKYSPLGGAELSWWVVRWFQTDYVVKPSSNLDEDYDQNEAVIVTYGLRY